VVPDWFRLLRHHQRRNGQALTLPFLLGARRSPPGKVELDERGNLAELHALIQSMRDEVPESYWIRVAECPNLRQPVVYLNRVFYRPMAADYQLTSPAQGRVTLAAQASYVPEPATGIDSLAAFIWTLSRDSLVGGRFSYSAAKQAFQVFYATDLDFIGHALSTAS
jgi:hypothetical protein